MLRSLGRWVTRTALAFLVLSTICASAEARIRPAPPKKLVISDASNATAPAEPNRSASPGSTKAPSGAHQPRQQPFDVRYVASVGVCFGSGPVVLPGQNSPVAWSVPGCPAGPPAPGRPAAPPPPTPGQAAAAAWWETTLPDPTMATSPPNGAVTGLDLYLSIGGAQKLMFDVASLGYNVHLEVHSTYDIDWGDPAPDDSTLGRKVTRGHRTQGGLYPNGDLRHQYIKRGSATINVTQRWTADWAAGGEVGTLSDVLYTQGTVTLPVQEIQAVITP